MILVTFVMTVSAPVLAHADEDDWSITRYDLTATAAQDGTTRVTINFDFDFAGTPGHGPYVTLPVRQEIEGDPEHYRSFTITDVTASSSTGAPADVDTERDGGALAIKVGDEDQEIEGVQTYELGYTITGLVNPMVAASGQDEIFWNVIGSQWEIPLNDVSVTLTGPAAVDRYTCFVGKVGSTQTCESATPDGDSVTFTAPTVTKGTGLTVVAAWPGGTFVGAEPELITRRNLGNTFTLDPATGAVTGLVAVIGVVALAARARRGGRDRQFAGVTPGLSPAGRAGGGEGAGATAYRDSGAPVAVQFTPPGSPGAPIRPGELGTLIDEVAHQHDVTATIIDLAVRGHLRIEEVPDDERRAAKKSGPWQMVQLPDPGGERSAPLVEYEQLIFDRLFAAGDTVRTDDFPATFTGAMTETQGLLYTSVTERGWFSANPSTVRNHWYGIGAGLVALGIAVAIALAITVGWGLIGVGVAVVGVVAIVLARSMPARTPEGSAVLAQTQGFKTYLETAEADQIRFEEGQDVFSRYLPYAIAFGVAEHWAKVFADLAARGHDLPESTWYVGAYSGMIFASGPGGFTDSLGAFSESATSAMTAASAGSSGGSGFSGGGFSGGGVGGGGGGGW